MPRGTRHPSSPPLFVLLVLILLVLACSSDGVIRPVQTNRPSRTLDQLADRPHVMVLVVNDLVTTNGDDTGIHYLDVEANTSYIALQQRRTANNREFIWLPEASIWTGESLVYLHRVHGVYALQANGSVD